RSVWVNEKTWPTWSEPLTVGGGVSIEYTSSRDRLRSKRYVPDASHCAAHLGSRPSSAGFSGTDIPRSYYRINEGSWFHVPGSQGSWFQVRGSGFVVPGSFVRIRRSLLIPVRTWNLEPGTWNRRTWNEEPGTCSARFTSLRLPPLSVR